MITIPRTIIYNGVDLGDFGVTADFSQIFKKPAFQVSRWAISGRNGDLLKSDDRFENVQISYNCYIRKDFNDNFSRLIDYLTSFDGGYAKLENSAESDAYRMASFHEVVEPSTGQFLRDGRFTLVFDCMPQEFLKIGDQPVSIASGATIKLTNPTRKSARPLIFIKSMSDDGVISINGQQISVFQSSYQIYIDCDTMHAYRITGSSVVSFDAVVTMPDRFVELGTGENTITCTGMTVDFFPRWWRL